MELKPEGNLNPYAKLKEIEAKKKRRLKLKVFKTYEREETPEETE